MAIPQFKSLMSEEANRREGIWATGGGTALHFIFCELSAHSPHPPRSKSGLLLDELQRTLLKRLLFGLFPRLFPGLLPCIKRWARSGWSSLVQRISCVCSWIYQSSFCGILFWTLFRSSCSSIFRFLHFYSCFLKLDFW